MGCEEGKEHARYRQSTWNEFHPRAERMDPPPTELLLSRIDDVYTGDGRRLTPTYLHVLAKSGPVDSVGCVVF